VSAGEEENMEKEEPDFRHKKTPDVAFIHLSGVADPLSFKADPDPAFYFNADPDQAFYVNAEPDATTFLYVDPPGLHFEPQCLHCERSRPSAALF
jgi:hypothetical protein